jgi:hypothetical protein
MGSTLSKQHPDPITVVYITSMGHSGSTLLDLLISGHPSVVSVGEVWNVGRSSADVACLCGAETLRVCKFWINVENKVRAAVGVGLDGLNLLGGTLDQFEDHNLALFEAVSSSSDCGIIVDSSKNTDRLEALLRCKSVNLVVIHLIRNPLAVSHSYKRKGHDVGRISTSWARRVKRTRGVLQGHTSVELRYERLVNRPAESLSGIMNWLGLEMDSGQLDFTGRLRHNIGGNRMRFATTSHIAEDTSWRSGLTPWEMIVSLASVAPSLMLERLWGRRWDQSVSGGGVNR